MLHDTTRTSPWLNGATARITAALALLKASLGTSAYTSAVDSEIPAGVIDGANPTFTLASTPVTGSVHLYLNGLRQRPTTDYTMAGNIITYDVAAKPKAGDNHVADYHI